MTSLFAAWLLTGCVSAERLGAGEPKPPTTIPLSTQREWRRLQWMAFVPGGSHLAVRSSVPVNPEGLQDAVLEVYDTTNPRVIAVARLKNGGDQHAAGARPGCAVSPKGDWVAYGSGNGFAYLPVPPHKAPARLGTLGLLSPPDIPVFAGLWVPRAGKGLYSEGGLGVGYSLYLVEPATQDGAPARVKRVLAGGESGSSVHASVLDPVAGRYAAVVESPPRKFVVDCWTLGETPVRVSIAARVRASSLAFAAGGKLLAVGFGDGSVSWHDTGTGREIKRFPPLGQYTVSSIAAHPTGRYLACGTADPRGHANVFFLDIRSGEVVSRFCADPKGVQSLCFSPNGDRLATCGGGGEIRIWNATALLKLERD